MMPPALVEIMPPMVQEPRAARSIPGSSPCASCLLQCGKRRSGLNDGDARQRIDFLDAVHCTEITDDLLPRGRGTSGKAGAPALWHQFDAARRAKADKSRDTCRVARTHQRGGTEITIVEAGIARAELGAAPDGRTACESAQFLDQRCLAAQIARPRSALPTI
jgi:hypothetical protein